MSDDDPISSDDAAVLRAEIARLRALVGPAEQAYIDLQRDLLAARDAARGAAAEAGTQRALALELAVQVERHHQIKHRVRAAARPTLNGIRWLNRAVRSTR